MSVIPQISHSQLLNGNGIHDAIYDSDPVASARRRVYYVNFILFFPFFPFCAEQCVYMIYIFNFRLLFINNKDFLGTLRGSAVTCVGA